MEARSPTGDIWETGGPCEKSGGSEFHEESNAYFRARDSGKPIGLSGSILIRELLLQNQFSRKHRIATS